MTVQNLTDLIRRACALHLVQGLVGPSNHEAWIDAQETAGDCAKRAIALAETLLAPTESAIEGARQRGQDEYEGLPAAKAIETLRRQGYSWCERREGWIRPATDSEVAASDGQQLLKTLESGVPVPTALLISVLRTLLPAAGVPSLNPRFHAATETLRVLGYEWDEAGTRWACRKPMPLWRVKFKHPDGSEASDKGIGIRVDEATRTVHVMRDAPPLGSPKGPQASVILEKTFGYRWSDGAGWTPPAPYPVVVEWVDGDLTHRNLASDSHEALAAKYGELLTAVADAVRRSGQAGKRELAEMLPK